MPAIDAGPSPIVSGTSVGSPCITMPFSHEMRWASPGTSVDPVWVWKKSWNACPTVAPPPSGA